MPGLQASGQHQLSEPMQLMKLDIANGDGQKNRLVFRQEKMIES